jgi:ribosome-associated protein
MLQKRQVRKMPARRKGDGPNRRTDRRKGGLLVKKELTTRQKILLAVNAALEKKAKNIVILNIKNVTSFADYTIICSGTSDRQVQSIASSVEGSMKKAGTLPLGIEGEKGGRWVLMDYADIIVHVFYEPVREFYDIERLWSDAPKMEVADDTVEVKSLRRGM